MSELAYKRTNVYEVADKKTMKKIFSYAEEYKKFIDAAKTEREACAYVAAEAEKHGFKPFKFGEKLKKGDKVLAHLATGGRHFGMKVEETITEK